MDRIFAIAVWFVATMTILPFCFDMVSAANTIENIVGLVLLIAYAAISVKTKCFIKIISIWKK